MPSQLCRFCGAKLKYKDNKGRDKVLIAHKCKHDISHLSKGQLLDLLKKILK